VLTLNVLKETNKQVQNTFFSHDRFVSNGIRISFFLLLLLAFL